MLSRCPEIYMCVIISKPVGEYTSEYNVTLNGLTPTCSMARCKGIHGITICPCLTSWFAWPTKTLKQDDVGFSPNLALNPLLNPQSTRFPLISHLTNHLFIKLGIWLLKVHSLTTSWNAFLLSKVSPLYLSISIVPHNPICRRSSNPSRLEGPKSQGQGSLDHSARVRFLQVSAAAATSSANNKDGDIPKGFFQVHHPKVWICIIWFIKRTMNQNPNKKNWSNPPKSMI